MGRAELVVALAAVGCYRPAFEAPCAVRCDDGQCPASLECGADNLCHAHGGGDCTTDASMVDTPAASPDTAVTDASTGPALVQQTFGALASTESLTANFASSPIAGDVLVMIGAIRSGSIQGVSGGGVSLWTRADRSTLCAHLEIWYGVTAGGSSTVHIDTSTVNGPGDAWLWMGEWRGLDTTNLLDQHHASGGNGTNATPAPGPITTTSPRELVLLGAASQTMMLDTPVPGTWSSLVTTGVNGFLQGEWYVVTSAADTFAPAVGPNTTCWDAAIASFRAP